MVTHRIPYFTFFFVIISCFCLQDIQAGSCCGYCEYTSPFCDQCTLGNSCCTICASGLVPKPTSTKLTASLDLSTLSPGQQVTFTSNTTSADNGALNLGGSVFFYDGSTFLISTQATSKGIATYTTSYAQIGYHSLTAQFLGKAYYLPSTSAPLRVNVGFSTTTTLTTSPPGLMGTVLLTGTQVVYNATVVGSENQIPNGTVTFFDRLEGTTVVMTLPMDTQGRVTMNKTYSSPGSYSMTAQYNGGPSSSASISKSITFRIIVPTITSLTTSSPSNAAIFTGQLVVYTSTVVGSAGEIPNGTVKFFDFSNALETLVLDNRGIASYNTTYSSPGSHSITAQYTGTVSYNSSTSNPLVFAVTISTTTSLTASPAEFMVGQQVVYTATVVSSRNEVPSGGTVTFFDGSTSLSTVSISEQGVAIYTTTYSTAGSHSIAAKYDGSPTYSFSTSSPLNFLLTFSTTTSLAVSPPAFVLVTGQQVVFTVTIVGSGNVALSGSVTFFDFNSAIHTIPVDAQGVVTYNGTYASPGSHSITAQYNGDASYSTSISTPLNFFVIFSTNTSLTASSAEFIVGRQVVFTAKVVGSGNEVPSGTVTFFDGNTALDTVSLDEQGAATYTTTYSTAGSHFITAKYNGATSYSTSISSSPLVFVLTNPSDASGGLSDASGGLKEEQLVAIIVSVIGALILILASTCYCLKRRNSKNNVGTQAMVELKTTVESPLSPNQETGLDSSQVDSFRVLDSPLPSQEDGLTSNQQAISS